MNSKAVGERSEGIILGALMARGFTVLLPFGNNQRYDMVFEEDGKFIKCQCKTGRVRNGCLTFNACSTNGFTGAKKSYRGQVDCFLVYCEETKAVYRFPTDQTSERIAYYRIKPTKKDSPTSKWAKDYEL